MEKPASVSLCCSESETCLYTAVYICITSLFVKAEVEFGTASRSSVA